jgi:tetratricopeptide (TPR) repeat protein
VRHVDLPRWNGEPRPNATLLIHTEQGLGDVLQFIRYLPQVRQRVGRIVTLVHPPLAAILRQSGFSDLFDDEGALPQVDLHVPMLSLPGILGTTVDNLPAPSPYLSASPELVAQWRERLAPLAGFRIGIAWQGSPKNLNDSARSFPLAALAPVAALPGVRLASLQKRDGLDQLQALGDQFEVHLLGDDLDTSAGAFMDTAAVMKNLDLVIAADTATAHLAGGLGVHVWVPLATRADWRWFQDREDTPWYPTMRLFRQRQPGEWGDVFARITDEVRRLTPDQFDGHLARARLRMLAGHTSAAMEHYRRVLAIDPNQVEALVELGIQLLEHGTEDEAAGVDHLRRALEIDPAQPRAVIKLAIRAELAGDLDESKALYDRALARAPDDPLLRLQRACVLLTAGDLARGWTEYAWRTKVFPSPVDAVNGPTWDGTSLGEGTLLVVGEQGIGDVLQFVRFLPQAAERTPHVVLTVRDPLVPLVKQAGVQNVQGFTQPLPTFAAKVALMDLPRVLGTTLENLPADVPYLAPRGDLVESWRARLANIVGFRVGICWKGSSTNPSDRNRSAPLIAFEPLARIAGVKLISLQKHEGLDELAAARGRFEVVELGADLDTSAGLLMDTAAIIPQLDLIVSIDSAIAHLAGALAAPVWVALARRADWRWLADRDDSPWYPTMRLFRQQRPGDWNELFARMAVELAPLAQRWLADRR